METTVEGVENPEQLAAVKAEGCTEMQGFLFSRALPAHDIERLYFSERRDAKVARGPAAA
jgi:EAL domain-containing protein (putative c-di-GMP-specific phosphodiesterase class I)